MARPAGDCAANCRNYHSVRHRWHSGYILFRFMFCFPALQNAKQFLQIEFMNSSVRADNVASPSDLHNIFSRVRPMGFTPLASALESKVLDPYYEMLRATPAANVKPMVIYVCTDGAPTTERGLKTYQPTFTMLGKVACFLSTLLDHQLTLPWTDGFHAAKPWFAAQDHRHQRDADRS